MLYSVELRLKVAQEGEASTVTGYHVYAFFLHLIELANPVLSARLHEEGGPKPFTLSPLSPSDAGERRVVLREGARLHIRVTLLQEDVFASLADSVWRLPAGQNLPLGGVWVACQGLGTTPLQSPRAAFTTFQELVAGASEERKLALAFLSPTTFRTKGERNTLFPEPSRVLGSLLSRWNAYAPADPSLGSGRALALPVGESAVAGVRLAAYRLSTRMLDFGSYQEQGFCGQATYSLGEGMSPDQVRVVQALGAFALYAGVGAKTTMGMGQAKRLEGPGLMSPGTGTVPAPVELPRRVLTGSE
ncbi:MAG: CRISPR system precrRNA processing endoribonuclease RAMP protein Cas6 [Chloroflexi bacterium]|nr:CRISPR system precrRNA processing endoribonuclease RAMP protein Cas6 [Chloroflexota bacterium]